MFLCTKWSYLCFIKLKTLEAIIRMMISSYCFFILFLVFGWFSLSNNAHVSPCCPPRHVQFWSRCWKGPCKRCFLVLQRVFPIWKYTWLNILKHKVIKEGMALKERLLKSKYLLSKTEKFRRKFRGNHSAALNK